MSDEEIPFLGPDILRGGKRRRSWVPEFLETRRIGAKRLFVGATALSFAALWIWFLLSSSKTTVGRFPKDCDSIDRGYECVPDISKYWGQYSPYFKVSSEISPEMPEGCYATFAQLLSRHAARGPTEHRSVSYAQLIDLLKSRVKSFRGDFAFLEKYRYELKAEQLTAFGEKQMINSGEDFFNRYQPIAFNETPFIRASGQERVVESAKFFSKGFHARKVADGRSEDSRYPYQITVISEGPFLNNTLSHSLCAAFEADHGGPIAQRAFASTFAPDLTARLNSRLTNAGLTDNDTISFMDLCPFETVASSLGRPSPFCALFSQDEWKNYDYYQTLGKYYGHGSGSYLGPSQGVGFANELIARLTRRPVSDDTSVNQTLDSNWDTFPLNRMLYADFSHDNDMTSIFAALGLYNATSPLSQDHIMTTKETKGYSAAWTVPFAGRAIFEKMQCQGIGEELVRILVNGRVLPLEACGGDLLGRCKLSSFVNSLSFARHGGHWDQCFNRSSVSGESES